jgi:hypothetical protein
MNKYKLLIRCVLFVIYLCFFWVIFPNISIAEKAAQGVEVSYLSRVFNIHASIAFFAFCIFAIDWLVKKAGES